MTNLDSIFKIRDITLPTKVRLVKAMVFPVVMYGCESWTVKKAERQRIDTFELWCWRRLLRVTWTARRSNKSILKEISPGCSLEIHILNLRSADLSQSERRIINTYDNGSVSGYAVFFHHLDRLALEVSFKPRVIKRKREITVSLYHFTRKSQRYAVRWRENTLS